MSEIHADRRPPTAPDGPLDLEQAGRSLLEQATGMASGRAAKSLTPGAHAPLTQTLVALRAGVQLGEHRMNGPSTIQLLQGRATLRAGTESVELHGGQWATVPAEEHDLRADEDVIALITSAPTAAPGQP